MAIPIPTTTGGFGTHPSAVLPAHNVSQAATQVIMNLHGQKAALERQNLILETRYISLR